MCAELLQAPETLGFFHENSNWQHSDTDRQSIFKIKIVVTDHFMLYLV